MTRGARWWAGTAGVALLVAGCATTRPPVGAEGSPTAADGRVACPQVEGQELPPECIPYDPDAAMAQNDAYRQRLDASAETRAALELDRAAAEAALAPLSDDPVLSRDAVLAALVEAGFDADDVAVRQPWGDPPVLDVVIAAGAGCLVGEVGAGAAVVEVAGPIADGGCFPAAW